MVNLKSSGMGGTMYKREDLMKGMEGITEKLGGLAGMDAEGEEGAEGEESPLEAPAE